MPPARAASPASEKLKIVGARAHNLKSITVEIPLRHAGGHHGRLRLRQIHVGSRRSLPRRCAAREEPDQRRLATAGRAISTSLTEASSSTKSYSSISRRSAARRAPIPSPTSRRSTPSASLCLDARSAEARLHAPGISPSIFPAAAAKTARATEPSPSKCSFSPTSN